MMEFVLTAVIPVSGAIARPARKIPIAVSILRAPPVEIRPIQIVLPRILVTELVSACQTTLLQAPPVRMMAMIVQMMNVMIREPAYIHSFQRELPVGTRLIPTVLIRIPVMMEVSACLIIPRSLVHVVTMV